MKIEHEQKLENRRLKQATRVNDQSKPESFPPNDENKKS